MAVHIVGVRHHSPACARAVRRLVHELRPAQVLIEGPVDMNARLDELALGHELPIAVFTSYRDEERHHASWSPFCAHSPEWVALTEARAIGAAARFIDLPAWHPAFARRANRYADAERRYRAAVARLCERFAVDNVDALWDGLFEIADETELPARLDAYFDLVRGEAEASEGDLAREAYMTEWIRAARADAGAASVLVVTGGFHRPALLRALAADADAEGVPRDRPEVPPFPEGAVGGSYLVPFSFRRLDAFDGYQSGMPSPHYYERLWELGPEGAAEDLVATVVTRLRGRRQPVSTADLVAARTTALALARLRGHAAPGRVDALDALVSALVNEALEQPLPWTGAGRLAAGTHPVVVEIVAALAGDRVGRLHRDTPRPPLLADVTAALERAALPESGTVELDLADADGRRASRTLHRLRLLAIPGFERLAGSAPGGPPDPRERWTLADDDHRLPALIEAGAYGATLDAAAAAVLGDRAAGVEDDPGAIAELLFDAMLAGLDALSDELTAGALPAIGRATDLDGLGRLLAVALALWRHDALLGARGARALAAIVDAGVARALWSVDGTRGGTTPTDDGRLGAIIAVRDAARHAGAVLSIDRDAIAAVFARARAADRPPDLRGAAVGMCWVLAETEDDATRDNAADAVARRADEARRAVRAAAAPASFGDFLSGLFAVAREELLAETGLLAAIDEAIGRLDDESFLRALPALRLAFSWFPPRERERVAERLIARHGLVGSARAFVRARVDPVLLARARALETRVGRLLDEHALVADFGAGDAP